MQLTKINHKETARDALRRFADVWDSLEIRNLIRPLSLDKDKAIMKDNDGA